jgi:hypothetical protein
VFATKKTDGHLYKRPARAKVTSANRYSSFRAFPTGLSQAAACRGNVRNFNGSGPFRLRSATGAQDKANGASDAYNLETA